MPKNITMGNKHFTEEFIVCSAWRQVIHQTGFLNCLWPCCMLKRYSDDSLLNREKFKHNLLPIL